MKASLRLIGAVVLTSAVLSCGGSSESEDRATAEQMEETGAAATWVVDLAQAANAIEQQPAAADSILRAHNLTRAAFDSLIYEIAADPALSQQYEQVRTK